MNFRARQAQVEYVSLWASISPFVRQKSHLIGSGRDKVILCSWARSWGQGRRPPIRPSYFSSWVFAVHCVWWCSVLEWLRKASWKKTPSCIPSSCRPFLSFLCFFFYSIFYENKKRGVPIVAPVVRHLPVMQAEPGLIPGLKRFSGEGNSFPLQYCCLENPVDRGTW